MTKEEAIKQIEHTLEDLNNQIKYTIFNEWILISVTPRSWDILKYSGPRQSEFFSHLSEDLTSVHQKMNDLNPIPGEFDFSYEGYGKAFDAYMCIGEKLYILFNNTLKNADEIKAHINWKKAERKIRNLQQKFMDDPVTPDREGT